MINFDSPFLINIKLEPISLQTKCSFDFPIFRNGLNLSLTKAVTFLVGENGTGKSTLIEALALRCGFNPAGGSRDHNYHSHLKAGPSRDLADALRLSWSPKISDGLFLRADTFGEFTSYIDKLAEEHPAMRAAYGDQPFQKQSQGEAALSFFSHRLSRKGLYILDEPESALSPMRQLAFLEILARAAATRRTQFIIATHSPILMSLPGSAVLLLKDDLIKTTDYRETDHFMTMKLYLEKPERFLRHLLHNDSTGSNV